MDIWYCGSKGASMWYWWFRGNVFFDFFKPIVWDEEFVEELVFCITLWIAELSVIHNTFCVFSEGGYARLAGGSVIHSQTYLSSYQSLSTHWMNTGTFGVTTHTSKCSSGVWTALMSFDKPTNNYLWFLHTIMQESTCRFLRNLAIYKKTKYLPWRE